MQTVKYGSLEVVLPYSVGIGEYETRIYDGAGDLVAYADTIWHARLIVDAVNRLGAR